MPTVPEEMPGAVCTLVVPVVPVVMPGAVAFVPLVVAPGASVPEVPVIPPESFVLSVVFLLLKGPKAKNYRASYIRLPP